MSSNRLLLCLVLGFLALSRPSPASATPNDPCSLLTADQVSAVLGAKVEPGKAVTSKMCQWNVPNQPNSLNGKKLAVILKDPTAFAYAKMPANDSQITKTPVTGVGDEAVQGTTMGKITTLTVKKGETVFVVHVTGYPVDQAASMEKTLATQIVAKL